MTTIKYHTKEEAMEAVTKSGRNLEYCTPEFQNDEDVVMTAIKEERWAVEYTSDELKSNKTFIMKALNEGVHSWYIIFYANIVIQSDIEVMTLAVEKSDKGLVFSLAKGKVALNKELAAKALVKWGNHNGIEDVNLLEKLCPSIQEFFPRDSWYEKAQSYLHQLEQEKQAELVSGGCTEEDETVW